MVTAVDKPQDKLKAVSHSYDAYLVKPVTKKQLLETARMIGIREQIAA